MATLRLFVAQVVQRSNIIPPNRLNLRCRPSYLFLDFRDLAGKKCRLSTYQQEGGTTRSVRFDFCSKRATLDERFSACFSYPGRRGAAAPITPTTRPRAQHDVLNRLPRGSTMLETTLFWIISTRISPPG
jgi:hypothetical protein